MAEYVVYPLRTLKTLTIRQLYEIITNDYRILIFNWLEIYDNQWPYIFPLQYDRNDDVKTLSRKLRELRKLKNKILPAWNRANDNNRKRLLTFETMILDAQLTRIRRQRGVKDLRDELTYYKKVVHVIIDKYDNIEICINNFNMRVDIYIYNILFYLPKYVANRDKQNIISTNRKNKKLANNNIDDILENTIIARNHVLNSYNFKSKAVHGNHINISRYYNRSRLDPQDFFNSIIEQFIRNLNTLLTNYRAVRLTGHVKCILTNGNNETVYRYNLGLQNIVAENQVDDALLIWMDEFLNWVSSRDPSINSNDALKELIFLECRAGRYTPTAAGSCIKMKKVLKSVINPLNEDNLCFVYAVLISLFHDKIVSHKERLNQYLQYEKEINIEGLTFPVKLTDIKKFENNNPNYGINVYYFHDDNYKDRRPLRICEEKRNKIIHLLYLTENDNYHYASITDINKFLGSGKDKHKKYFCDRCASFGSQSLQEVERHREICNDFKACKTIMPKNGVTMFKNYQKAQNHPMVLYSDLEAILEKVDIKFGNSRRTQKHICSGWGIYNTLSKEYKQYPKSENCINDFIDEIKQQVKYYCEYLDKGKVEPLRLNREQNIKFLTLNENDKCYICNKPFGFIDVREKKSEEEKEKEAKEKETKGKETKGKKSKQTKEKEVKEKEVKVKKQKVDKVRDHDHFTGEYRGAAHSRCNLMCKVPNFIPILFHNGSGYDIHHLIAYLIKCTDTIKDPNSTNYVETSIIPISSEKFISFSIKFDTPNNCVLANFGNKKVELRFLDSFRFMAMSLDKLVKFSNKDLPIMKTFFNNENDFNLLTEKGIFPYEWFDSLDKMNDTCLPEIEAFTSKLSGTKISEKDYDRANSIWKHFNMESFKDYHDLYLKTDVLLLSDVFENFRTKCFKYYGLDPVFYFTCANLAWDCILKYTAIELEMITDQDMYMFFEKGIRGGISQVGSQRYAKKSNKNVMKYVDCNNLYGYCMLDKIPYKDFKWLTNEEINNIKDLEETDDIGHMYEVDLKIPKHLHDYFKELPLCAENININKNDLSIEQQKLIKHEVSNIKKLCTTLYDKKKYILTREMLKFCLEEGMVLEKIHRGVSFKQKNWMAPYIQFNSDKRALAKSNKNDFEVEFFKLMNNSVFGKTMEDCRKYQEVKIVMANDEKRFLQLSGTDKYKDFSLIGENNDIALVNLRQTCVCLNKPIYCGMKILDLSKLHMYKFFYRCLKPKFDDKVKLLYMDTDSFFVLIETENIIKEFSREELDEWFDTSNYDINHPWYSEKNKMVIGKFKDEVKGKEIYEFCGLASKMYSFTRDPLENNEKDTITQMKLKGTVTNVVKTFNFDKFKDVLKCPNVVQEPTKQFRIQSKKHQLYTIEEYKRNVRLLDDKRYIIPEPYDLGDGMMHWVKSVPIGYKK